MLLKELINKSVYGTIGYLSSQEDLYTLEQYIGRLAEYKYYDMHQVIESALNFIEYEKN